MKDQTNRYCITSVVANFFQHFKISFYRIFVEHKKDHGRIKEIHKRYVLFQYAFYSSIQVVKHCTKYFSLSKFISFWCRINEILKLFVIRKSYMTTIAFGFTAIDIFEVHDIMSLKGWHLNALQKPSMSAFSKISYLDYI